MTQTKSQIKSIAENNFEAFARLVQPQSVIGSCHSELMSWMTSEARKSHQLILMPRDHRKSYYAGLYGVWEITRNPAIRILYISSMSNLATKQLKLMKDILISSRYRDYWPDMVNEDEGLREKWTQSEISVDHPKRKAEFIRDPTIFTAGLTTNIVGLHCDLCIMDDVVTAQNAWTEEGREKVLQQYSLLSSIEGTNAREVIVGTRYHPNDLYSTLLNKVIVKFDEQGRVLSEEKLYEVFLKEVEDRGDGTGQFLWPRQQRSDGEWFGFNSDILAVKRAQYGSESAQFRAQYYNNPNDIENAPIKKEWFQYYDKSFLTRHNNTWYYKNNKLNTFCAIDFAYSKDNKADFTSCVVVGIDTFNNYYILDIDRFKSDLISDYFKSILKLHEKWGFHKVRAEVTAAQVVIVKDLKQNYIRPYGLALSIEDYRPTRVLGSKEERIYTILQPRYANRQIWHYQGGHCQTLEEELIMAKPPHDDLKDSLATCVDFCIAPSPTKYKTEPLTNIRNRFGGV